MRQIMSIVGARPQFIKSAIVSLKLKEIGIEEKLLHTGQHYDHNMSDIFFQELHMSDPDWHLDIGSGTHGQQTGRMLEEIEKALLDIKPELVMVYGDTNTTLAGALAAAKLHIPVAHVESGLRSFNKRMPEEINRILTDHASDLLFCPTETGVNQLQTEGFTNIIHADEPLPGKPLPLPLAVNIGDVMYDIALKIRKTVNESEVMNRRGLKENEFILATVHRAENTDNKANLVKIWSALKALASGGKTVYFPLHPRTRTALRDSGLLNEKIPASLIIVEPVAYTDMIALESCARVIVTDSGGVQKESYFFDTPCVVTRDQTEWVELLSAGWTVLTGADTDKITASVNEFWKKDLVKEELSIFGDGHASDKIAEIIGMV